MRQNQADPVQPVRRPGACQRQPGRIRIRRQSAPDITVRQAMEQPGAAAKKTGLQQPCIGRRPKFRRSAAALHIERVQIGAHAAHLRPTSHRQAKTGGSLRRQYFASRKHQYPVAAEARPIRLACDHVNRPVRGQAAPCAVHRIRQTAAHQRHLEPAAGSAARRQRSTLRLSPGVEKIDPNRVGRRFAATRRRLPQNSPHPPQPAPDIPAQRRRQVPPPMRQQRAGRAAPAETPQRKPRRHHPLAENMQRERHRLPRQVHQHRPPAQPPTHPRRPQKRLPHHLAPRHILSLDLGPPRRAGRKLHRHPAPGPGGAGRQAGGKDCHAPRLSRARSIQHGDKFNLAPTYLNGHLRNPSSPRALRLSGGRALAKKGVMY